MKLIKAVRKVKKSDSGTEMKLAREMYHLLDDVEDKVSGIKKLIPSLSKEDAEYLIGFLDTNETRAEGVLRDIKNIREALRKVK